MHPSSPLCHPKKIEKRLKEPCPSLCHCGQTLNRKEGWHPWSNPRLCVSLAKRPTPESPGRVKMIKILSTLPMRQSCCQWPTCRVIDHCGEEKKEGMWRRLVSLPLGPEGRKLDVVHILPSFHHFVLRSPLQFIACFSN